MPDRREQGIRFAFVGLTQRENSRSYGGAPVVIVRLANELVRKGISVDVLVFTRRGVTTMPFPFDRRVRLHYLRARSREGLLLQVVSCLLRVRPCVMLAVGTKANLVCTQATWFPGVSARFWATFHHNLSSELAGWSTSRRRRRVRLWNRILGRAEGLIAVSRGVANDFIAATGIGEERVRVVYNPIIDSGFAARAEEPADHAWLGGDGPPVILGVGRLTRQKDFATLVSAFALVCKQLPCRLLIIGEGEERKRLEALAVTLGVRGAFDLAGFQANPLPYMREARLLVMSSRWEGFGNVLVEALYCQTPVVSTDCPHGPREILAHGEFGRLVPVGDPPALADAMISSLGDNPDQGRLRARAEDFSADSSADGYLDALGLRRPRLATKG